MCPLARSSPLSLQLTQLFLPNPGLTLKGLSDPGAINFDFNNVNRGDNLVAKTDYTLNSHDTLSARFIYANTQPDRRGHGSAAAGVAFHHQSDDPGVWRELDAYAQLALDQRCALQLQPVQRSHLPGRPQRESRRPTD